MNRSLPLCKAWVPWLKAQTDHHHRRDLAALTGQDSAALGAFVHALDLYARADSDGRGAAIIALWCLCQAIQPKCRQTAFNAIPAVLDWSDQAELWPILSAETPPWDLLRRGGS